MKTISQAVTGVIVGCFLFCSYVSFLEAQTQSMPDKSKKEATAVHHIKGVFDVKVVLQKADSISAQAIGRMSIDKQYHGDLEATGKGQMLAIGTGAKGSSGGYVAMEWVKGTLLGRSGTFALQHSGTMTRGEYQLSITVVPDSGTDELLGLSGTMMITIVDKKHFYDFEYTFAGTD